MLRWYKSLNLGLGLVGLYLLMLTTAAALLAESFADSQPLFGSLREYRVVMTEAGNPMSVVGERMASPTLDKVRDALARCGAKRVHPRTLDALNLVVLNVFPKHLISVNMVDMHSEQRAWMPCVLESI